MTYRISYAVARQIADQAQARYPQEACGLLAGMDNCIHLALPLTNAAAEPERAFAFEPKEQLQALKSLDAAKLEWIGVYHSHPQSRPVPSARDINAARDFALLHLIVSLQDSKPAFKLWQIQEFCLSPLGLQFAEQSRQDVSEPALAMRQKMAVVLAGVISVLLLLAVSLSLLPAAPLLAPVP